MKKFLSFVMALAIIFMANPLSSPLLAYEKKVKNLSKTNKRKVINKNILYSVAKQNEQHKNLTQEQILALDKQWLMGDYDLVLSKTETDISRYLRSVKEKNPGLYTEIFTMDNRGLIVATSDPTTDYWQGDEDKWLKTYGTGNANSIHISDPYFDDSTHREQVQLSLPLVLDDQVIGAITFGISKRKLD